MRILALITARGGSKRIPNKNIRLLGGKPLIAWSIDVAKDIPEICDILVSTDDPKIADIARTEQTLVPWLRPAELSTDEASSVDVALHALDWYERENGKVDGILLIQPTFPFRSRETLLKGLNLYRMYKYQPVLGVSPVKDHPLWCFKIEGDHLQSFIDKDGKHFRSQDLPEAFVTNGVFYLISPDDLRNTHSFYSGDMLPLVIDSPQESLDIDTEWDWSIAEMIYNTLSSSNKSSAND
jgi:CMP-N,N'-diacetyllegionaminic acid synthase